MLLYFRHYASMLLKKVVEDIVDAEKVFLFKHLKGYLQVVEELI